MSVTRTVLKNTGILVVLEVLTRAAGIILTVAIARSLGAADYGLFMFAFSFGGLFGMFARFGLDQLVTREVSRSREKTGTYLGMVLVAESVLSIIAIALMIVILVALGNQPPRIVIVVIAGVTMLVDSFIRLTASFFRACQRVEYEALVRTVLRVLNVSVSLAVLRLGSRVTALVGAQLTVSSFAFLLSLYLVRERVARPVFPLSWCYYRGLLKAALPFALCMAFITIYQRTGTILLSFFKGDEVTGWYSGAGTFGRLFDFIPMSLQGALLPVMAQFAQKPGKTWQSAYRHSMKYLMVVGLPIATGLAIRSRQFVHLLLGEQYDQSAGILSVLIWALVFSFMNHGASNALISLDGEKTYLKIVGFGAACNVAINFVLVPVLGPYGAAIAQLLTECLVLIGQFRALAVVGRRIALRQVAAKPLVSAAVLALVLFAAREAGLMLAIPLSAVAYVGSLFLLQTFERDEILIMAHFAQSLLSRLRFQRSGS